MYKVHGKDRSGNGKSKAYTELYVRLDTKEREKELYWLAGQRDRAGKDVEWVRVIKDKDGKVLMSEEFGEK